MFDIDTVFRSLIDFRNENNKSTIDQEDLFKNFRSLQELKIPEPEDTAYKTLYHFIVDFLKSSDTSGRPELPTYDYIKEYFENVDGSEAVLSVLSSIREKKPYIGSNYREVLKKYKESIDISSFERILTNGLQIANNGLTIGYGRHKKMLKGISESLSYIANESKELQISINNIKLESQIISKEDIDETIEEYNLIKKDPEDSFGISTGISIINDAIGGGLKNQELMIVAAAPGHCKTAFSKNMAYRSLIAGYNTAFITLEMSHAEIRRAIYLLHSCHPKFKNYHNFQNFINLNNLSNGDLTQEELEYYKAACEDLKNDEAYGKLYVWQPDKALTTVSDIELKLRSFQYDLQKNDKNLDFVVIDYIGLMGIEDGERSHDSNQNLNNIIKKLKRLCLTFNNGKGIRMLSPFQMNREGYKQAKQNNGIYNYTALSNAHEAERSADIIFSFFINDEDRKDKCGRITICNLKNRRNSVMVDPVKASIHFPSGFIYDYATTNITDTIEGIELLYNQSNG